MEDTSEKKRADSDHCEVPVGAMKQAPDREELKVNVIRQTRAETPQHNLLPEKVTKRARGSGSIFQNGSNVWWVKYYDHGIARRESSRSTERREAEKLLKRRLAEIETDIFVPRQNIRIDELIQDVLNDHRANGRRSTQHVEARWRLHLAKSFSRMKACDLSTSRVEDYKQQRLAEWAARATLNRELSLLKRAMRLGFDVGKVKNVPKIKL